eukprot:174197_1
MHINKYHLSDIGLKSINKKDKENDGYCHVIAKRNLFNKMTNYCAKANKFVTQVLDHADDSKQNNYAQYSFGVRFYYHEYYKNNHTKQEMLPGTRDMYENGNMHLDTRYSYASWFVSPKHKTIKDEVLNDAG